MLNQTNQPKIKRILQSSKYNKAIALEESRLIKDQKRILSTKKSNVKYKNHLIYYFYNKLFINSNEHTKKASSNNKNINIDRNTYNNNLNNTKRNMDNKYIRNPHKYRTIKQKNTIPFPMNPIKRNSKDKLKISTKFSSYMSNNLNRSNLKASNSTSEINLTIDENNSNGEYQFSERKKETFKFKKNEYKKNNNINENFNIINISNNNINDINLEQKNNIKKGNNCDYIKLSNNNNTIKKINNKANNKVFNNIEYVTENNKSKTNKNVKNKVYRKKVDLNSFRKKENKNNKNHKQSNKNKYNASKKNKNNLFDSLKENRINYCFLVVTGNKFVDKKNDKEKYKFRNTENNSIINNKRIFILDKLKKHDEHDDKIQFPPINNIIGNSTTKSKHPFKQLLLFHNDEMVLSDESKKSIKNNNLINKEQTISSKNNLKYKNNIINHNIMNNNNKKKKNNYLNDNNVNDYVEEKNNKPYSQKKLLKNEINKKLNSLENKKDNALKKRLNRKIDINNKKYKSNNIDVNEIFINSKSKNIKQLKNNNSNLSILDTNKHGKYNYSYNYTLKKSNKSNNIQISKYSKNINSNKKDNIYIKKLRNISEKQKKNSNKQKYCSNKLFLNNFDHSIHHNSISIFYSDEDDITDKEEEEGEISPRANKLVTYFNDAKKTLFNKNENINNIIDVISPNKTTIFNPIYNHIEEDELSNRTIKVPIFVDVNLLNNLLENNINNKNINLEIKNLYDIISKSNDFKPKQLLLNFLDDKSLMILSFVNRQFYINLRHIFYNNIYKRIFNDKKNIFLNKIKTSMFSYASIDLKNCDKLKLRQIYESLGNKKSIYDDLIIKDINRTFPYDLNYRKNTLKYEKLYNLLTRYSNYKKSIGYSQGLNYIFAHAMTYFEKDEEVFLFIDGLINLFKLENFMGESNSNLTLQIKKFSNIISKYIPDIIKYLSKKFLTHEFFSTGWILTLFSNSMNPKNLMITWCFMIVFGWKFFYCFVIQILYFYSNDIYKTSESNISKKMKKLLKEERFNYDIRQIINNTFCFMSQNLVL